MKKKTFALTLTALTLTTSLSGCGLFGASSTQTTTTTTTTVPDAYTDEAVALAPRRNSTGSPADAGNYFMMETATEEADEWWYFEPAWTPDTESYEKAPENGYYLAQTAPLSTFSASVDTASYTNVRRMIEDGASLTGIRPEAVRAEEFVNYFHYDLNLPKRGDKFGLTTKMAACPWNEDHKLLFVGMRTEEIDFSERGNSNLVFLIDVSGSMSDDNKLPLLVKSFKELTANLTEKDTVSIVTYASGVDTVLYNTPGSDKQTIINALESLNASGSTNGEGGIQRAYELAESAFIDGGINRVIIATDGDLNVGVSDNDQLQRLIEQKRDSGIYLSVLGFGMGNYKDDKLERLANYGNGNYAYIDSLLEAKKVLVEEMGATLVTVADDVKLQVEFNPARVNAYRLIGYENRMLDTMDFHDDTKDAGEIGAGHQVIALYEIIETGSEGAVELKYGTAGDDTAAKTDDAGTAFADEYATVKIRYKEPGASASQLIEYAVDDSVLTDTPDEDFTFAAMVVEFAMILSDSSHKGNATLDGIMETCRTLDISDDYRNEFYYLVRKLAGRG